MLGKYRANIMLSEYVKACRCQHNTSKYRANRMVLCGYTVVGVLANIVPTTALKRVPPRYSHLYKYTVVNTYSTGYLASG